jgi:hypothetical protein
MPMASIRIVINTNASALPEDFIDDLPWRETAFYYLCPDFFGKAIRTNTDW